MERGCMERDYMGQDYMEPDCILYPVHMERDNMVPVRMADWVGFVGYFVAQVETMCNFVR